jgi:acyl carrier protein
MADDTAEIDQIRRIISTVARIEIEKVTRHASLRNDLWIDSLQAIQVVAMLEEQFSLEIDEIEIFNVDTVQEIVDLLHEYREENIQ